MYNLSSPPKPHLELAKVQEFCQVGKVVLTAQSGEKTERQHSAKPIFEQLSPCSLPILKRCSITMVHYS
jgi:hypothetical protein